MMVRVKLVSMEGGPPPKGFDEFGEADIRFSDPASIADLLERIAIDRNESWMVLVNGETSPPSGRSRQMLVDGDNVTIFPPMQGG